jgi:hypothetical protein
MDKAERKFARFQVTQHQPKCLSDKGAAGNADRPLTGYQ